MFNRALPLYDRATFHRYLVQQYSGIPPTSSSWYASFNMVLCLGYNCRRNGNPATSEEPMWGWGYFQNAMSVLPDLIFRNPDTMSIQALLAMVCDTFFSPAVSQLSSLMSQGLDDSRGLKSIISSFLNAPVNGHPTRLGQRLSSQTNWQ